MLIFILSVVLFVLKEEGDNSSYVFITAFTCFGVSLVSLTVLSFYVVIKGQGFENLRKKGCCFLFENNFEQMKETDGLIDSSNSESIN